MKIRLPKSDKVWYGLLATLALILVLSSALAGLLVTRNW